MVTVRVTGSCRKTRSFLRRGKDLNIGSVLDKYGKMGVEALSKATPKDSGKTSESWGYEVEKNSDGASIIWTNSNVNQGVNIALILQYGHGTGWGGYVQGIDYINPALKPIFDQLSKDIGKEISAL